jgi:hypothetical protein
MHDGPTEAAVMHTRRGVTTSRRNALRDERGTVLVVVILLIALMLSLRCRRHAHGADRAHRPQRHRQQAGARDGEAG